VLVERRRRLDGDGFIEAALAGQAVALADEVLPELHVVGDRGRRDGAGHELHTAGCAAATAPTGGGDVHAGLVGSLEDRGAGRRGQGAPCPRVARIDENGERDAHGLRL
jgi:hypothetical protein